jgi:16S rRNA (guanine527-N7)-methyltransferase
VEGFSSEQVAALIARLARALTRDLEESVRAQLGVYVELVARWNRKVNLTGASDAAALVEVLLADAFVLADSDLVPAGARVLDVGTGAGAPIVPLLLLRPELSALCVEPLGKRATFLRMLSARLALLPRMRVRQARIDPDRPAELEETFDLACSRATFEPERWLRVGLRFAPRVLVLLGSAQPPAAPAGARLLLARPYALPFSGSPRVACAYLRE